jgi:signal transduction histidine kinase
MRIFLAFGIALALATAAGLTFAAFVMRAPASDVQQLALILAGSGAFSLLLAGAGVRFFSGRRVGLRVWLGAVYGAGLLVTLVNVLAASLLMFISSHDLLLLLLVLGFATALSLVFGYAVTGALVADLGQLAGAAGRLAAGDLRTRTGVAGADEVARLGAAFDHMAERLEAGIERERAQETARREMVAAVSHDLRTPLTTMRAMIEAITDGVVSEPEDVQRYLGLVRSEVHHLSGLIDDLFELSQIESGALRLDLEPTHLSELVAQTLDAYEAPARDVGITLENGADDAIPPMQADPARLMRVLRNLIDNALRHTPAGGRIEVEARLEPAIAPTTSGNRADLGVSSVGATGKVRAIQSARPPATVRVSVRDTGPGLPEGEIERVFDRFFQGAPARTRSDGSATKGAGLGLTIARGLVQAHGGRMWAESRPGAGATFFFTLPLSAPSIAE